MSAANEWERVQEAVAWVHTRAQGRTPRVGVVLGSGLGAFADTLEARVVLPYAEMPHQPSSAVVGHAGNLVLGRVGNAEVACLQGRVHFYEGHEMARVVFGVRVLAALGCSAVLLTNAAGGIGAEQHAGSLMLITDHLNLLGDSPLTGPNEPRFGPRFPDLTVAYDAELRAAAREVAQQHGITLSEGVYAAMRGPAYETPAEVRMLRTLGAHAVGMSTVPEVLALRHQGVRVGAVSCITNAAAGLGEGLLDHAEVEATAKRTRDDFLRLLGGWVERAALLVDSPKGAAR